MRMFLALAVTAGLAAQDHPPHVKSEPPAGHTRYWDRIFAYEPTYFLVEPLPGGDRPFNAKFQLSMSFQVFGEPDKPARAGEERPDGFYAAYSQTSFWDLESDSKPFYDSSYRPEFFWHQGFVPGALDTAGLGLEGGFAHESNGKTPPDSRSQNLIFLRPIMHWELGHGWWVRAAPRFHAYLGDLLDNDDLADNPDIARYRGYANLDAAIGTRHGAMLALRGRIGDEWDRGSLQADFSYPLDRVTHGWVQGFVYVQAFAGYSESLLAYDQHTDQPRILIGFAITR